jgi:hypothetical protein
MCQPEAISDNNEMKGFFTTIIIFFSLMTVSCERTPDLTQAEVYKIINEIVADDSLKIYRVCWKFKDLPLAGQYLSEFTTKDIEFNKRQKVLLSGLKIHSKQLRWIRPRDKAEIYSIIDTTCNTGILYHLTLPIITQDRKRVLIEFNEDCNCELGGQGGKTLYERINGRWVRKKTFDRWVS